MKILYVLQSKRKHHDCWHPVSNHLVLQTAMILYRYNVRNSTGTHHFRVVSYDLVNRKIKAAPSK